MTCMRVLLDENGPKVPIRQFWLGKPCHAILRHKVLLPQIFDLTGKCDAGILSPISLLRKL